jgi:hypothetical protein
MVAFRTVRGTRPRGRSRAWAAPGSFGALISERKQWLFDHLPEDVARYQYDIFHKTSQKRLAARLGMSVASTLFGPAPLSEVIEYLRTSAPERFVIKPNSGHSRIGFHRFLHERGVFTEVGRRGRRRLGAVHEMLRRDFAGRARPDEWLVEEMLLPADGAVRAIDNYHFFCFAGRVEFIMHVRPAERPSERALLDWYTRDWLLTDVKARRPNAGPARAPVNAPQLLATAEGAAARLCYPFIRMDLYATNRGIVFGEFTPGPGGLNFFKPEVYERLGRLWYEAEALVLERIRTGELQLLGPEAVREAVAAP